MMNLIMFKRVKLTTMLFFLILVTSVQAGELVVSWNPNLEEDLDGYKIYYGVSSGQYSKSIDVGNVSSYTLSALNEGINYYLVVTAYDTARNESAYSEEVWAFIDITDNVAPYISEVQPLDERHVVINFSESVEKSSAEDITNYSIVSGVNILKAELLGDNKRVRLTTTAHEEKQYTLIVNNVKDRAATPNTILPNSNFQYEYIDNVPPAIVTVQASFDTLVNVTFSETIEKTIAENSANFVISKGIVVKQAVLDSDQKTVHLLTSPHLEGSYTITINNVKDRAKTPNKIGANSKFNYDYFDVNLVTIINVEALDEDHVQVVFSEPVEQISAEDKTNYDISGGVTILAANLDVITTTVHLVTTAHIEGIYTLTVSNVKDRAANPNIILEASQSSYEYIDRTPPEIINVLAITDTQLDIVFSEQIEKASAENKSNYSINNGIEIYQALLDNNKKTVHLTSSKHGEGIYSILVRNIRDRAKNPNIIENGATFDYQLIDTLPPEIKNAVAANENKIDVTFNEPIEKSSAESITNYSINNGMSLSLAILDENLKIVHLTTSNHKEGTYTLSVSNIKDRAITPNKIKNNSTVNYQYIDQTPPVIENVRTLSDSQVVVQFSEPVDRQSAENISNYSINNGVVIYRADLDSSLKEVLLNTSVHNEGIYALTVHSVKDRANDPNEIQPLIMFEYQYIDIVAPSVLNVTALDENHIDVLFTEFLDKTSAENLDNFLLNNSVEVTLANLDTNGKVVHLTTTTQQAGSYILILNNIKDRAQTPNVIKENSYVSYLYVDTSAPVMTGIETLDANHLKVIFSEKIERTSAESMHNYEIQVADGYNGTGGENAHLKENEDRLSFDMNNFDNTVTSSTVNILSINLDSNERIVHIQTTTHNPGKYRIIVNQIKDKAVVPNSIIGNQQLEYEFLDTIPPSVSEIVLVDKTHLKVIFSELLDRESAENTENYKIDNGIEVLNAQLDSTLYGVQLTTSQHDEGKTYNLTMNNIYDLSLPPNVIIPNSISQYIYKNQQSEIPASVTFNSVSTAFDGTLILNWEKNVANNILGYKIYYGSESRSYDTIIDAGNVLTYSLSGLIEGKKYFFAITAYNIYNRESDFSNEQVAVVQVRDLIPPKIASVSAESDTEVVVVYSEKVDRLSSENINNYNINKAIQVYSASQDTNGQIIRLVTSAHSPGEYEMVINNIRDQALVSNVIEKDTKVQYQFFPNDFSRPAVTELNVINRNHVDIWFNESLEKRSSEKTENYSINNNITVYQSRLDLNEQIVHLTTSDHISSVSYLLSINGVGDLASPPNYIEPNTKLSYSFVKNDTIPPEIYAVRVKADTLLQVYFTEMVQLQQAVNIDNYNINDGIQILQASIKSDNKTVQLITTPHKKEVAYFLSVNSLKDFATPPNIIENNSTISYAYRPDDNTPPEILAVETKDESHVDVIFSEMIDRFDAELEYNYTINKNIVVFDAKIDNQLNIVHLITSKLTNGESYTLSVSNIKDIALYPNVIVPNSMIGFSYVLTDKAPPMVNNCYLENEITVIIEFNEIVERESAENVTNYKIDNGIEIFEALLDNNLTTVRLTTSEHENNKRYTLNLNNIRDRAFPPNTINQNLRTVYSSRTTSEALVQDLSFSNYQLNYLTVGEKYYIDRNYIITKIPLELTDCLWVKTADNDAANRETDFLNFKLNEKAMIYVAFDSKALNYPEWLVSKFHRIGKSINVSDSVKYLDVWAMEAEPGKVSLGGNQAAGAEGVNAMYVVLIKGENQKNMLILNGMNDPDSKNPSIDYVLYQNYPNPFNEGTKIKFQLTKDSDVEIKIFNILGQTVTTLVQGFLTAGNHLIQWNGRNTQSYKAPSGIYFVRMIVKRKENVDGMILDRVVYSRVRKMLFVK